MLFFIYLLNIISIICIIFVIFHFKETISYRSGFFLWQKQDSIQNNYHSHLNKFTFPNILYIYLIYYNLHVLFSLNTTMQFSNPRFKWLTLPFRLFDKFNYLYCRRMSKLHFYFVNNFILSLIQRIVDEP